MHSFAGDDDRHERFHDYVKSSHAHRRMKLSEELSEFNNETSCRGHQCKKRKHDSDEADQSTDQVEYKRKRQC